MKIKKRFVLIVLSVTFCYCWGQPTPEKEDYIKQIDKIANSLEKDSLNHELIWQKLKLQTTILFWEYRPQKFYKYPEIMNNQENEYMPNELDYHKVFKNVIIKDDYSFLDEGDYYLSRIDFYRKTGQIDKAIEDAYYLKNLMYSAYGDRLPYYHKSSLYALFELYAIKGDFHKSLATIDLIIAKEKFNTPIQYFTYANSSVFKLELLEHFKQEEKIIAYLKQLLQESFDYYFETNTTFNDSQNPTDKRDKIKEMGFGYLKQLILYMKHHHNEELPIYEERYRKLKIKPEYGAETINYTIDDTQLKEILSSLK